MKNKTQKQETSLFKAGMIFMLFGIVVAVMNYLFHLFMGRMLGPEEYGVLGSLFAIIYIVSLSVSSLNLVVSKHIAEFHGKNEKEKIKMLFKKGFKKIALYGLIPLAIYLIITPLTAKFMNLDDYAGIVLVGLIAYFYFFVVLFLGILNGIQKFIWQNSSNFALMALKLSLAIFFVYIGFGVNGALTAFLIGVIISILIAYIPVRKELDRIDNESFDFKKIYLYAIPVFLSSIFFISIITLDQILVKHFFLSSNAGIYAAAGNIGKIIWYGSCFLAGPLFPKVVSLKARSKNTSKMLRKALAYTFVLAMLGCIVFYIAPSLIVKTLYGESYASATPLVFMFGVSMGIFSLIQLFMIYNLAVEKYNFIYIFLAGVIFEIAGIYFFHDSLAEIVKILLGANIFILAGLFIYNRKELLNNRE